uniref:Uncharacterized protein n=1 Tax=Papilio xuthus TaxID=66420 RepID=I4DLR2_PAPXU|nr:unknown unsecreted protein [Papilio xuthus]
MLKMLLQAMQGRQRYCGNCFRRKVVYGLFCFYKNTTNIAYCYREVCSEVTRKKSFYNYFEVFT